MAVAPFEQKLAGWVASNGQTAQYEGSGPEPECLLTLVPLGADEVNPLDATDFLLGEDQLRVRIAQNAADPFRHTSSWLLNRTSWNAVRQISG